MTSFSIGNDLDEVAPMMDNKSVTETVNKNLTRSHDEHYSESEDSDYSEDQLSSEELCISDDDFVEKLVNEIKERHNVSSAVDDYGTESLIFTEADWKTKEKAFHNRFKNGYYRCKIKNSGMYK